MAYPCQCSPSEVVIPPCSSGNCLKVPNITINPLTSVLPCGGTFNIDIGQYSDFSVCDGTIEWSVVSFDATVFENVAISSAGVLTGSTAGGAVAYINDLEAEEIIIIIQAACLGSLLAVQREIKIPIKDACLNKNCAPGFTCNPCTGGCIEGDIDLILT